MHLVHMHGGRSERAETSRQKDCFGMRFQGIASEGDQARSRVQ